MNTDLTPYLVFDGTAREAATFYADVLGGTATITAFGAFGTRMAGPEYADLVMHGRVEDADGGLLLIVEDLPPGDDLTPGNNVSLFVNGSDAAAQRQRWEKVSTGGTVVLPLEDQMWGEEYGRCVDRFGTTWHISIAAG